MLWGRFGCLLLAALVLSTAYAQTPTPTPTATVKKKPKAAAKKLPKKPAVKPKVKRDTIQLDFNDVEIKEVVKAMSRITGYGYIYDDTLRGKITIITPKPITVREAQDLFLNALSMKGFTTVKAGKMMRIVPLRQIQSEAIPAS